MRQSIRYLRNGEVVTVERFDPREMLLDHLRLTQRATGTKEGCNEGDCGACTVVLGRRRGEGVVYEPVNSCITFTGMVDGCELVAVEDLADGATLHPVQSAMVSHHASQCGFCTPGIVMSLFALYHGAARPVTRQVVNDQLAGNLCRCTGYRPIVDAALEVCGPEAGDKFAARRAETAGRLDRLRTDEDVFVGTSERFFAAPVSIDALADLYLRHPDATLVSGATDVGLWVTKHLQDLPKIIWVGRVSGFDRIEENDSVLSIGAGASHAAAEASLGRVDPDLGELMRRFGSKQVRASGTVGGNIANGSPIGDLAPAFIALGARLTLRRGEEVRFLDLERFFLAYGRQDRQPSEFVVAVDVPKLEAGEFFRCFKVSKRFDEDISAVMGAFKITIVGRRIASARIAFGGLAGVPKRAETVEAELAGADLDDGSTWPPALDALASDFRPLSDMRASSRYRMEAARALLLKALVEVAGADPRETRLVGLREAVDAE